MNERVNSAMYRTGRIKVTRRSSKTISNTSLILTADNVCRLGLLQDQQYPRSFVLGIQQGDRGRWHHRRSAGSRSDLFGESVAETVWSLSYILFLLRIAPRSNSIRID